MRCTLPHVVTQALFPNATANVVGTVFSMIPNGMYQVTPGSSRQPYSFDSLCTANGPYTKFKVLGFKLKITVQTSDTSLGAGNALLVLTRVVNITDNFAMGGKTIEECLEKPNTRFDVCPCTGSQSKVINIHVPDLSVLFNWSREQYHADILNSTGTFGGNPTSNCHLDIGVACASASSSAACTVIFEWLFDTVFLERQTLPQS